MFELKATVLLELNGRKTIVIEVGDQWPLTQISPGEQRLLERVKSLLGDEETSDVVILVMDDSDKEIGKFFCHMAILSGEYFYLIYFFY